MKHALCFVAIVIFATLAFGQVAPVNAPSDAYQVRYMANLTVGDSVVNLTNTGVNGGFEPGGNICANVYVIDPDQEVVACCSCPLTPNHLKTLSGRNDLTINPLHAGVINSATVALLASAPLGGTCSAATPGILVGGLRAWGTTLHALPGTPTTYGVTETEFSHSVLSASELSKLAIYCGFIQTYSGYGICKSCQQGAQGAAKQ
jgi:hypothetical protein